MYILLSFVVENFFLLLLFAAMFAMKEHRLAGLALLTVQVLFGTVMQAFIAIIAVQVLWELTRWSTYGGILHRGNTHHNWKPRAREETSKESKEEKLSPLSPSTTPRRGRRRDPDYEPSSAS